MFKLFELELLIHCYIFTFINNFIDSIIYSLSTVNLFAYKFLFLWFKWSKSYLYSNCLLTPYPFYGMIHI
jgi:hypothetical protein